MSSCLMKLWWVEEPCVISYFAPIYKILLVYWWCLYKQILITVILVLLRSFKWTAYNLRRITFIFENYSWDINLPRLVLFIAFYSNSLNFCKTECYVKVDLVLGLWKLILVYRMILSLGSHSCCKQRDSCKNNSVSETLSDGGHSVEMIYCHIFKYFI